MMKRVGFYCITLISLLLLSSCSSILNKDNSGSGFASVDIAAVTFDEKVQPLINSKFRENIQSTSDGQKVKKVTGLFFGPGLNRTVGFVPMLKHIDNQKISYHVLSGTGLGAIVSAYVASNISYNKIDWDFFQLLKELDGKIPYSEEWVETVEDSILVKFKGKKIESLSKLLLIPLFDTQKKEIKYVYKGDLYLALKYNLQLMGETSNQKYISALRYSPYSIPTLNKFGVDNWFGFDVLGDNLEFNKVGSGYLIGVLGKIISSREESVKDYAGFYKLPLAKMSLDSVKNIPRFMKYVDEEGKKISEDIKNTLEK